jgi:hypothetical protein
MKRIKAILIIITGLAGFMIMPSDNLTQATTGIALLVTSLWMGSRNWRSVTRELILINRWIEKNLLGYKKSESTKSEDEEV